MGFLETDAFLQCSLVQTALPTSRAGVFGICEVSVCTAKLDQRDIVVPLVTQLRSLLAARQCVILSLVRIAFFRFHADRGGKHAAWVRDWSGGDNENRLWRHNLSLVPTLQAVDSSCLCTAAS